MHTVNLPLQFGHRQCDRLLVHSLAAAAGRERPMVLWCMFLVWKDFATAREDRREVPLDPAARAASDAVLILEEYIGWSGAPGSFVEPAINAGFFTLTPVGAGTAELVLTDFFPANAPSSAHLASVRGGVNKSLANAKVRAEAAASDQMQLFAATGEKPFGEVSEKDLKAATRLVFEVCNTLRRPHPKAEEWKNANLAKAIDIVRTVPAHQRESVLRWFVRNRSSQTIPLRLDLVLTKFTDFIPEATREFGA